MEPTSIMEPVRKLKSGRELEGLTAMMAMPSYEHIHPGIAKCVRVAMMTASNHGLRWAGDVSAHKLDFGTTRNMAAQSLFDHPKDADGIIWVDTDILLEPDSILKLLGDVRSYDLDFLCGVYHKKGEPYDAVFYGYDEVVDSYRGVESYGLNLLLRVYACGFGFVWTSFHTIDAMFQNKAHWDDSGKWFPDTRHMPQGWRSWDGRPPMGEDFNFCDKARMAGIKLYVDTGIQLGHMGDGTIFNRNKYLDYLEKNGGKLPKLDKDRWRDTESATTVSYTLCHFSPPDH